MITFSDFLKHETLENELKSFLAQRCNEFNEAKAFDVEDYYKNEELKDNIDCWEMHGLNIVIWFRGRDRDTEFYTYELPLDILFDTDFKSKMKARFDEERERQRLALIEKRMKQSEENKKREEAKKQERIEMLRELMKEFPEIVRMES